LGGFGLNLPMSGYPSKGDEFGRPLYKQKAPKGKPIGAILLALTLSGGNAQSR